MGFYNASVLCTVSNNNGCKRVHKAPLNTQMCTIALTVSIFLITGHVSARLANIRLLIAAALVNAYILGYVYDFQVIECVHKWLIHFQG